MLFFASILVFTRLASLMLRRTEILGGMFLLMPQLPDFEQYSKFLLCNRICRKFSRFLNLILKSQCKEIDSGAMGITV